MDKINEKITEIVKEFDERFGNKGEDRFTSFIRTHLKEMALFATQIEHDRTLSVISKHLGKNQQLDKVLLEILAKDTE